MPDSLLLDGTTSYQYSDTGDYIGTGAFTAAAIIKSTDAGTYEWLIEFSDTADGGVLGLTSNTPPELTVWDGTTERNSISVLTLADNEWHLIAATKAAGTATPRFHRFRYSDSNWVHANTNQGTLPNFPAPADLRLLGSSGEKLEGNMLICGLWDSELSDAAIELLPFTKSAWADAAPKEAFRFDTAAIPFTGFIGSATWNQRNGSVPTLDVGDAPAGWSDEGAAGKQTGYFFRRRAGR